MVSIGEKARYCNHEAIILARQENEVLLFIDNGYVKWVDEYLLDMSQLT